jgi:hypothetical protein
VTSATTSPSCWSPATSPSCSCPPRLDLATADDHNNLQQPGDAPLLLYLFLLRKSSASFLPLCPYQVYELPYCFRDGSIIVACSVGRCLALLNRITWQVDDP